LGIPWVESQNTEYKERWRDEYFQWICGYANAQGGRLLIGVDVMVQACREYGLPDPVLRYDDSGFWVEFVGKHMEKTTQKTTQKILPVLKENPAATRKEIAAILGNIT